MVDVTSIQSGTVFAWFMLLMVVRRVVILIVAGVARRGKPVAPGRVPEDYKSTERPVATSATLSNEFPKDVRVNRTINNDSENDTYFLILLLSTAVFSDTSATNGNGNVIRTIVYGAIYLFARIGYAIAYIMALQPWRSLCFALGLACTLACSLDLVITMSRRSN